MAGGSPDPLAGVDEAARRIERGLAALLLVVAGLVFAYQARPQSPVVAVGGGGDVAAGLEAMRAEGAWGAGAALALVALASLICAGLSLRYLVATRLPAPRPPEGRPGMGLGLWLFCYGALAVTAAIVLPLALRSAPDAALWQEGEQVKLAPNPLLPLRLGPAGGRVAAVQSEQAPLLVRGESSGVALELRPDAPAELELWVGATRVPPGHRARVLPGEPAFETRLAGRRQAWNVAGPGPADQLPALFCASAAGFLAVLAVLVLWSRTAGERSTTLAALGVHTRGWRRELLRGAIGYLGFLPLYFAALALTQALAQALEIPAEHHPLIMALQQDVGLAIWIALSAAVLAPLSEELLFRGLVLTGMREVFGGRLGPALVAQALVFAAVHPSFSHLLPMVALGLLFGYLRATSPSESLLGSLTAHALHNGLTIALAVTLLQG